MFCRRIVSIFIKDLSSSAYLVFDNVSNSRHILKPGAIIIDAVGESAFNKLANKGGECAVTHAYRFVFHPTAPLVDP
jgi:hypothetical protein